MSKFKWCDNSLIYGPYFCLCLNEKEFHRQLKRLGIIEKLNFVKNEQSNATVHYMTNQDCRLCCIVCIKGYENKSIEQIYSLLVHEAVHIWQEFKDWFGEKEPSREFEAYSIQAISEELMYSFKRQNETN